jgi:phage nucleotide-binding protein
MSDTVLVPRVTNYAGLEVRPASKMPNNWGVCVAIYGPGGAGKSTLVASAVDSEDSSPVVMLDAEGGARSIAHLDNVDVIEMDSWAKIDRFTQKLKQDPSPPWKTVGLDNMSEYQSVSLKGITSGAPQIQDYGKSTLDMLRLTRDYRDMSRTKGLNVFFIAWDAPEKDDYTGILRRDVGFTPSLARQFPGIVDIVGFLEVVDAKTRKLTLESSPRLATKFRRSQTDIAKTLPGEIWIVQQPDGRLKPSMADIIKVLRGVEKWDPAKFPRPQRSAPAQQQQGSAPKTE